jgi:hypothetical protein
VDECKPLPRGRHAAAGQPGRGLHSSPSQLNISTFCVLHPYTFQFVVSTFPRIGCEFTSQKRLRLSWEVDAAVASMTTIGSG